MAVPRNTSQREGSISSLVSLTHALAHAHTPRQSHLLHAYVISLFCAITLKKNLLVSLKLNTKSDGKGYSATSYVEAGCRGEAQLQLLPLAPTGLGIQREKKTPTEKKTQNFNVHY